MERNIIIDVLDKYEIPDGSVIGADRPKTKIPRSDYDDPAKAWVLLKSRAERILKHFDGDFADLSEVQQKIVTDYRAELAKLASA